MKILVGICGIGNGHCSRQSIIIDKLIERGHDVRILTYGKGIKYYSETKIKTYKVFVPFITFKGEKINFLDVIEKNFFKAIPGFFTNLFLLIKLKITNFIPDVCISDYEPTVALFSYIFKKPLINIDQQSKFLYMSNDNINGFSILEEKNRLNLFFPRYTQKIIFSFYKVNNMMLPNDVLLVPAIIKNEIKINNKPKKNKKVIVYFSKFIDKSINQDYFDIFNLFGKFSDFLFVIYINDNTHFECNYSNIVVKYNKLNDFSIDFGDSCAVISTAGHTLISEAIYCNIPTFVIPLPTYDQNYCAKFILNNKIGYSDMVLNYDNLSYFLNNIDYFKKNLLCCENILCDNDSLNIIIKEIEKYESNY